MTESKLTTDWKIARSVAVKLVVRNPLIFFGTKPFKMEEIFKKSEQIAEYIVMGVKK